MSELGDIASAVAGSANPVSAVANLIHGVLDRVIPDPAQNAAAKLAVAQLEQTGELAELTSQTQLALAQTATNTAEANAASGKLSALGAFFIAGWRPAVGWSGALCIAWQFWLGPVVCWVAALCGRTVPLPAIDIGSLMGLMLQMLGLAAMRSYEKKAGVGGTAGSGG